MNKKYEMIKTMIAATNGGQTTLAAAINLTEEQFKRRLYQMNGTKFFTVDELEHMQTLSNTTAVATYFADSANARVIKNKTEEANNFDLFLADMNSKKKAAELTLKLQEALEDGVITKHEAEEIIKKHSEAIAAESALIQATILLHSKGHK